MPSVAGTTVNILSGSPKPLSERAVIYQTPGYDGYGVQLLGTGDNQTDLRCVLYGTSAAVKNTYELICGQQSNLVTIVNDLGQTYNNTLIQKVGQLAIRTAFPYGVRGEFTISVLRG